MSRPRYSGVVEGTKLDVYFVCDGNTGTQGCTPDNVEVNLYAEYWSLPEVRLAIDGPYRPFLSATYNGWALDARYDVVHYDFSYQNTGNAYSPDYEQKEVLRWLMRASDFVVWTMAEDAYLEAGGLHLALGGQNDRLRAFVRQYFGDTLQNLAAK